MREGERGSQARRGKARVSPKQRSESKKKAALDPSVLHSASLWRRVSSHFSLFAAAKGHGGGGRRERERRKREEGGKGHPTTKTVFSRYLVLSRTHRHTGTHIHADGGYLCVCVSQSHTRENRAKKRKREGLLEGNSTLLSFSPFSLPSLPLSLSRRIPHSPSPYISPLLPCALL